MVRSHDVLCLFLVLFVIQGLPFGAPFVQFESYNSYAPFQSTDDGFTNMFDLGNGGFRKFGSSVLPKTPFFENFPFGNNFPFNNFAFNPITFGQELSSRIQNQVYKTLQPVREMSVKKAMSRGHGGVTIAHVPSGRQYMIMNGSVYSCQGNIVMYNNRQPSCNGQLELAQRDICMPGPNMIILNNILCMGDNIGIVNNKCYGGWEGDINLVRQSCGYTYGSSNYASYDYYPTEGIPSSVQFYNNPDAKCQNQEANHCVFSYF